MDSAGWERLQALFTIHEFRSLHDDPEFEALVERIDRTMRDPAQM